MSRERPLLGLLQQAFQREESAQERERDGNLNLSWEHVLPNVPMLACEDRGFQLTKERTSPTT
ncbi:hypothetical protein E2C01_097107 [Portunus trituberculatus]|uniref:Uncharacterized protein n=1 Tax=Portunus trituberculatus TaxID=210409 RepID=A0A5B7JZK1_PORTR|nr:hypothetical protein [Portunus trituberculatus]